MFSPTILKLLLLLLGTLGDFCVIDNDHFSLDSSRLSYEILVFFCKPKYKATNIMNWTVRSLTAILWLIYSKLSLTWADFKVRKKKNFNTSNAANILFGHGDLISGIGFQLSQDSRQCKNTETFRHQSNKKEEIFLRYIGGV